MWNAWGSFLSINWSRISVLSHGHRSKVPSLGWLHAWVHEHGLPWATANVHPVNSGSPWISNMLVIESLWNLSTLAVSLFMKDPYPVMQCYTSPPHVVQPISQGGVAGCGTWSQTQVLGDGWGAVFQKGCWQVVMPQACFPRACCKRCFSRIPYLLNEWR